MKSCYQKPSCTSIHKPQLSPGLPKLLSKHPEQRRDLGDIPLPLVCGLRGKTHYSKQAPAPAEPGFVRHSLLSHKQLLWRGSLRRLPCSHHVLVLPQLGENCQREGTRGCRGKSPLISPKGSHLCDRAPACPHPMQLMVPSPPCSLHSSDPPFLPLLSFQGISFNHRNPTISDDSQICFCA